MNAYTLADLYPGLSERFETLVDEACLNRFAELCGDFNPLHTESIFARQSGFDDRLVHGMLTASFYSTLVGMYLPGKHALLHGIDIEFKRPVYPGTKLAICGTVNTVHDNIGRVELRATIIDDDGRKVSQAKIRVGLHV